MPSRALVHACRYLDGRVWPKEDEKQVKLLFAFIHHCTGQQMCLQCRACETLLPSCQCLDFLSVY